MTREAPPDPPEGLIVQTPDEWFQVWRRVITTTPTKAVGYAAAQFADWVTGAEVRPGNELLARICGCSTKSVERAFAFMRDHGLVWRYHKAVRQGDADIYRLTAPEDTAGVPMLTDRWEYPPDSQSGADKESPPDSQSGGHPTESLVLHPTVSLPTSVKGDLTTDLSLADATVNVGAGDGDGERDDHLTKMLRKAVPDATPEEIKHVVTDLQIREATGKIGSAAAWLRTVIRNEDTQVLIEAARRSRAASKRTGKRGTPTPPPSSEILRRRDWCRDCGFELDRALADAGMQVHPGCTDPATDAPGVTTATRRTTS